MKSSIDQPVAIIGGGFSGLAAVYECDDTVGGQRPHEVVWGPLTVARLTACSVDGTTVYLGPG